MEKTYKEVVLNRHRNKGRERKKEKKREMQRSTDRRESKWLRARETD
jgi:hypothetical protein